MHGNPVLDVVVMARAASVAPSSSGCHGRHEENTFSELGSMWGRDLGLDSVWFGF